MAYSSSSDVREIMRKLPSSITDQEIEYHIGKADAFIDSFLGGVFDTPFREPFPKVIKYVSADLAVFYLSENLYTSNMPNMDEYQEKRYERVMEILEKIAGGDLNIGVTPKYPTGFASTNDEDPIFTLDKPYW
ncbi:phage protein Gp36 family protein [Bacillus paralicheniformis]|uniref:phage protein Gp36 family protein n=1 Tax=Bacillus paralicheniformis TaxID=1648923 RepID=UPI0011A62128|nr:phage protein Gp36 family protein [Bacillus paralicheniformis]